jgi:transaldolase
MTIDQPAFDAVADHGEITGDTITPNYGDAQKALDDLEANGGSYNDVVQVLEVEGVDKFEKSWDVPSSTGWGLSRQPGSWPRLREGRVPAARAGTAGDRSVG